VDASAYDPSTGEDSSKLYRTETSIETTLRKTGYRMGLETIWFGD